MTGMSFRSGFMTTSKARFVASVQWIIGQAASKPSMGPLCGPGRNRLLVMTLNTAVNDNHPPRVAALLQLPRPPPFRLFIPITGANRVAPKPDLWRAAPHCRLIGVCPFAWCEPAGAEQPVQGETGRNWTQKRSVTAIGARLLGRSDLPEGVGAASWTKTSKSVASSFCWCLAGLRHPVRHISSVSLSKPCECLVMVIRCSQACDLMPGRGRVCGRV